MCLAMTLTRISRILAGQEVDADEQRMHLLLRAFSMGLLGVCLGGAALLIRGRHACYAGMTWTDPQAMPVAGFLYYLLPGMASLLRMRMLMLLKHRKRLIACIATASPQTHTGLAAPTRRTLHRPAPPADPEPR